MYHILSAMTLSDIGYTIAFFCIGIAIAIAQRKVMQKIRINSSFFAGHKNIGIYDRLLRAAISLALIIYGLYFSSSFALIGAGYAFYEAIAKWCGFYAIIGRSTCPI